MAKRQNANDHHKKKKLKDGALPVTLLSGFLGSGKTTLLKRLLMNPGGLKIAVLVNDMAEINVDGLEVASLVQKDSELVQLQNGCICCTLRMDLVEEVGRLAELGEFDVLVIESTGISEPMQVAETFSGELTPEVIAKQQLGSKAAAALGKLASKARLDTCITVVDVCSFFELWGSVKTVQDDSMGAKVPAEDTRALSHLLTQQVEFSDLIVLNKIELADRTQIEQVKTALRALNSKAEIVETSYSDIPISKVVLTGRFDMDTASGSAGWMQDLDDHKPETVEYGISSFMYHQRKPFNPERLHDWMSKYFFLTMIDNTQPEEHIHDEHCNHDEEPNEEEKHLHDEHCNHTNEEEKHLHEEHCNDTKEEEKHLHDEHCNHTNEEEKHLHDEHCNDTKEESRENLEEDDLAERERELEEIQSQWSASFGSASRLLRSKGVIWMAGYDDVTLRWGQSGHFLELTTATPWMVDIDPEQWSSFNVDVKAVMNDIQTHPYGDRHSMVVMIGQGLDEKSLTESLNACLLTDEEMALGMEAWAELPNPFVPQEVSYPTEPTLLVSKGGDVREMISTISNNAELSSAVLKGFVQDSEWSSLLPWAKKVSGTGEIFEHSIYASHKSPRSLTDFVGQLFQMMNEFFTGKDEKRSELFKEEYEKSFCSYLEHLVDLYPETIHAEMLPYLHIAISINGPGCTKYYDLSSDVGLQTALSGKGVIIAQNDKVDWELYDETDGGILEELDGENDQQRIIRTFNNRLVSMSGELETKTGDLTILIGEELSEYPCIFRESYDYEEGVQIKRRFQISISSAKDIAE